MPQSDEMASKPEASVGVSKGLDLDNYLNLYNTFKSYMEHESTLVNNRLTWILTIHGFLYATYGFTIQKQLEVTSRPLGEKIPQLPSVCYTLGQTEAFLAALTLVGACISLFGLISIRAAQNAAAAVSGVFDAKENKAHTQTKIAVAPPKRRWFEFWKNSENEIDVYVTSDGYQLPNLRGGGFKLPVKRGNTAAYVIPIILLSSWILSLLLLGFIYINNKQFFCLPWDNVIWSSYIHA